VTSGKVAQIFSQNNPAGSTNLAAGLNPLLPRRKNIRKFNLKRGAMSSLFFEDRTGD